MKTKSFWGLCLRKRKQSDTHRRCGNRCKKIHASAEYMYMWTSNGWLGILLWEKV